MLLLFFAKIVKDFLSHRIERFLFKCSEKKEQRG